MGMDLCGEKGRYFRWSGGGWGIVLDLALQHGWEPTGTGPPPGTLKADWVARRQEMLNRGVGVEDEYYGNGGQRVYARAAASLADALGRALEHAASSPPSRKKTRRALPVDELAATLGAGPPPKRGRVPREPLSAEMTQAVREFITFCRGGSFRIY